MHIANSAEVIALLTPLPQTLLLHSAVTMLMFVAIVLPLLPVLLVEVLDLLSQQLLLVMLAVSTVVLAVITAALCHSSSSSSNSVAAVRSKDWLLNGASLITR
jgi:hypothetical protein